jgi:hypothetical protein
VLLFIVLRIVESKAAMRGCNRSPIPRKPRCECDSRARDSPPKESTADDCRSALQAGLID